MIAQINKEYIKVRPWKLWSRLIAYALFEGRPLTTRGRWINELVFMIAKCLYKMPKLKAVTEPIFIVGTGRSGTTILGVVMSIHKQIGFLNEPKATWAGLYNGEDLIGSYNQNNCKFRLGQSDVNEQLKIDTHKVFGGFLRISGSARLLDKYPELVFRIEFVRSIFPDARFLFLSRSGIKTCGSIAGWSERYGRYGRSGVQDWWGLNDRKWLLLVEQLVPEHQDLLEHIKEIRTLNNQGRAAVEWVVNTRNGINLCQGHDPNIMHIPYEELCSNPKNWAILIQKFLNLNKDLVFERYAIDNLKDQDKNVEISLPVWLSDILEKTQKSLDELTERTLKEVNYNE